ncbi:hypothetical protein Y032_0001g135 [Ancylostoma ceylanicum]|uniref:Uncharacterized protein n=1 Tax=Ancylostoma ceylanicum TaxID=53326 RepID=A0A016W2I7_9BILA|nr:hypothetical protein Y032_0001g135 [Ancylostoma ceylanicum]
MQVKHGLEEVLRFFHFRLETDKDVCAGFLQCGEHEYYKRSERYCRIIRIRITMVYDMNMMTTLHETIDSSTFSGRGTMLVGPFHPSNCHFFLGDHELSISGSIKDLAQSSKNKFFSLRSADHLAVALASHSESVSFSAPVVPL